MDMTPTTTTTSCAKSREPESETPERIQPSKSFPSYNGVVLKSHRPHLHHQQSQPSVIYKECLKNHAASLGGHAVDGCGEFMPSPSATSTDPTSLKCAACGCHRNFHRCELDQEQPIPATTHILEYQPHHRYHPPPPPQPFLQASNRSANSASPPPISSSYFPSAHMLLALSSGLSAPSEDMAPHLHASNLVTPSSNARKRVRTKFTQDQKDRMYQFAERVGWKMQKRDDELVQQFCSEIGLGRTVLKVWMHNNKNTLGKKDVNGNRNILEEHDGNDINNNNNGGGLDPNHYQNDSVANGAKNGSSSSY